MSCELAGIFSRHGEPMPKKSFDYTMHNFLFFVVVDSNFHSSMSFHVWLSDCMALLFEISHPLPLPTCIANAAAERSLTVPQ
jgi:hypothetical protein